MVDATTIRAHMAVVGSDGEHVGTVDAVEGDRIKLTRSDSRDGSHHYLPLTAVDRVGDSVHLSIPAISAIPGGAGESAGAAVGAALGSAGALDTPFPPTRNRAIDGAPARRNFYLPWIVGAVGLILLFLLFKSCVASREAQTQAPVSGTIAAAPVADAGMLGVSGLGTYLAGTDAAPRSFAFERLTFDTASATVRPVDRAELIRVAETLRQYDNVRVRVIGYADARGSDPANVRLGQARADAVKADLVDNGVDAGRVATGSGGERDPADTNATAGGRAENRRTVLVVTAR